MEKARELRDRDIEHYDKCSLQERAELGLVKPKPWDEDFWRRNARKASVRSKPYEILSAAEQCAEMAIKAGWEDVEIVEVKKEVANDQA